MSTSILQPLWEKITNSPTDPFLLLVYAHGIAKDFVRDPPTRRCRRFCGDERVLDFLNDTTDYDNDVDCE